LITKAANSGLWWRAD